MSISRTGVSSLLCVVASAAFVQLAGCDKKPDPVKPAAGGAATGKGDNHAHKPGDGHDHGGEHDHGPAVALGEQLIGGFTAKASRDGELKAGGEAPVDVEITGGTTKVSAVRFWIGTQDGKGSVKAKAEIEKGTTYHTHVEVPSPLPAESKLWVEIENDKGEKATGGFELKASQSRELNRLASTEGGHWENGRRRPGHRHVLHRRRRQRAIIDG